MRALVEGLNDPEHSSAVPEAIRALVHRIALTPVLRPGKKRATPTVGLGGALAAILSPAAGTKTKATSHAAADQVSNAKKPASGEEAGFQESMVKLVARARFGNWLKLSRASNL